MPRSLAHISIAAGMSVQDFGIGSEVLAKQHAKPDYPPRRSTRHEQWTRRRGRSCGVLYLYVHIYIYTHTHTRTYMYYKIWGGSRAGYMFPDSHCTVTTRNLRDRKASSR